MEKEQIVTCQERKGPGDKCGSSPTLQLVVKVMAVACKLVCQAQTVSHLVRLMDNSLSYQLGFCLLGLSWGPSLFHRPDCLQSGLTDTQRSQKDRLFVEHGTLVLLLHKHPSLRTPCPGRFYMWLQRFYPVLFILNWNIQENTHSSKTAARFKQLYQQRMQCWRISVNPGLRPAVSPPTHFPGPRQDEMELVATVL